MTVAATARSPALRGSWKNSSTAAKKQLVPIKGGTSQGDPCEAYAYHGFNGVESDVVKKVTQWMLEK